MLNIINTSDNLVEDVKKVLEPLGGMKSFVKPGEKIFVKPNFNTSDPFPASSDLNFIRAALALIEKEKPKEIILGDSPTYFGNCRKYFCEINPKVLEKEYANLRVLLLNDEKWEKKENPRAKYLKKPSILKILDDVDRIIYLACLKTHYVAEYTGALKLAVGLLKPQERVALHVGHLQEKIAELNLLIKPDLVIMDARKCFIDNGPASGTVREPKLMLASTNRTELDIEGVKIIQKYPGNSLAGQKPEDIKQIKYAMEIGIK